MPQPNSRLPLTRERFWPLNEIKARARLVLSLFFTYTSKPGAWEAAAKGRADLKASKLKPPSLLFSGNLIFDDGKHRVELMHLGVAHTHGDAVAWLHAMPWQFDEAHRRQSC